MLCGLDNRGKLMVRVGPRQYEAALKLEHAAEMDFTGKPLRGIIYVRPEGFTTDKALSEWIGMGLKFTSSLRKKAKVRTKRRHNPRPLSAGTPFSKGEFSAGFIAGVRVFSLFANGDKRQNLQKNKKHGTVKIPLNKGENRGLCFLDCQPRCKISKEAQAMKQLPRIFITAPCPGPGRPAHRNLCRLPSRTAQATASAPADRVPPARTRRAPSAGPCGEG